jgi:hypothetical protein
MTGEQKKISEKGFLFLLMLLTTYFNVVFAAGCSKLVGYFIFDFSATATSNWYLQ